MTPREACNAWVDTIVSWALRCAPGATKEQAEDHAHVRSLRSDCNRVTSIRDPELFFGRCLPWKRSQQCESADPQDEKYNSACSSEIDSWPKKPKLGDKILASGYDAIDRTRQTMRIGVSLKQIHEQQEDCLTYARAAGQMCARIFQPDELSAEQCEKIVATTYDCYGVFVHKPATPRMSERGCADALAQVTRERIAIALEQGVWPRIGGCPAPEDFMHETPDLIHEDEE
jgi:hypothetical protein